jgi:hypothetical protein
MYTLAKTLPFEITSESIGDVRFQASTSEEGVV